MRRGILAVLLIYGIIGVAACSVPTDESLPTPTTFDVISTLPAPTEMGGGEEEIKANCESLGARYELIDEGEGPIAYCILNDVFVCEALALFNGDCSFEVGGGGGQDLPEPTPWAYPTPVWDVETQWPYGQPGMAIPFELSFTEKLEVYVLLGSDWMPHRDGADLTDLIMIVMLDTEDHTATVISVPRDLYVFIPGWGLGRINQAWSLGRFDTVKDTIRYNFGLDVDAIAYARMYAAERFIDQGLGGLNVYVGQAVLEQCGDLEVNLLPGEVFMDGEYALCYARGRTYSNDFTRMSRQQEILYAMKTRFIERAANDPIGLAEELYGSYVDAGVTTDLPVFQLPGLVWNVIESQDHIRFYRMVDPLVEHFDHPISGAWLLMMPTPEEMHNFLFNAYMGVGAGDLDPRN